MSGQECELSFVSSIMDMIDEFLANYEKLKGPLRNDLERGLVISYILGVMRCDVDAIWDSLGKSPIFGALHPRAVFEDCVEKDETVLAARQGLITEELRKRGWAPLDK